MSSARHYVTSSCLPLWIPLIIRELINLIVDEKILFQWLLCHHSNRTETQSFFFVNNHESSRQQSLTSYASIALGWYGQTISIEIWFVSFKKYFLRSVICVPEAIVRVVDTMLLHLRKKRFCCSAWIRSFLASFVFLLRQSMGGKKKLLLEINTKQIFARTLAVEVTLWSFCLRVFVMQVETFSHSYQLCCSIDYSTILHESPDRWKVFKAQLFEGLRWKQMPLLLENRWRL